MNYLIIFSLFLTAHSVYSISRPIEAVCIVPVADLLSQRLSPSKHSTIQEKYALLPFSEKHSITVCCRVTQLLFNERVTIIEQKDEQSFIETPFWHSKQTSFCSPSTRNNRFWTLTKNLLPLSTLAPEEIFTIPPAETERHKETIVTLTSPWYCHETKTVYSAGTQFLLTGKENTLFYFIKFYDPQTVKLVTTAITKNLCILNKKRSDTEKRELFVQTITHWAHGIPHQIPYLLGGASIIETCKNSSFYEKKITFDTKTKGIGFVRPECTAVPHKGVDCAGLVRLACKIADIPLTATNSKSIAQSLSKLTTKATVQNGDILFWKGHIAVISDTQKGLLIEARSYEHGYGCVQEIPYAVELKGMETTATLMNAYVNKKPLQRLDKQGHYRETITDLTVLSLLPIKQTAWIMQDPKALKKMNT